MTHNLKNPQYPTLLFIADCYKYTHASMYPQGLESVYSVLYCRNPRLDLSALNGHIVAFGMRQAIAKLKTLYAEFKAASEESIKSGLEFLYSDFMNLDKSQESYHFLIDKWLSLPNEIPIHFKVVPEGSFIPSHSPIITLQSTKQEHCWFVNFIETYLNSQIWKSCLVATNAARFKRIEYDCLGYYLDESWNFHDFAQRGMNGIEDCYNSSMGHILFFNGTDSMMALKHLYDEYGAQASLVGSIPASEHSVMCLGGQSGEVESFKRIMRAFPKSMVSIVSDTWNLWEIIEGLKRDKEANEMIQNRAFPIVLRPDSGDPFLILTGDAGSSDERARKGVIRLVDEYFSLSKVRIIYGDAITVERARAVYDWCKDNGYNPTEFLCFGIGSYAYNSGIRDDVGLVSKMTWARINGENKHLIKSPITGGEKLSLSGKVGIDKHTRKTKQFLDSDLENDFLSEDLSIPSLGDLRGFVKAEFLRVLG